MKWNNVIGYEGLYEVSDTGLIRGVDRYVELPKGKRRLVKAREIMSRTNNYGYVEVRLSKNGVTKTCFVHRLVATAFIANENNLPQVNHLSGDKLDNSIGNLEWTDARGNALHAYQNGLNSNCGCTHNLAVTVININTGETYCTIKEFSKEFGLNYNTARSALNGNQPFPKSFTLLGFTFTKAA